MCYLGSFHTCWIPEVGGGSCEQSITSDDYLIAYSMITKFSCSLIELLQSSTLPTLVRKPHAKRNQRRAITIQPDAGGVLCAPKNNKKRSTMKSEDRDKQNCPSFFPRIN
jgi:hypothetical protein